MKEKDLIMKCKNRLLNNGLKTSIHEELSCLSKKKYDTYWQAKFAADEQMSFCPCLKLRVYECEYCNKWHMTKDSRVEL